MVKFHLNICQLYFVCMQSASKGQNIFTLVVNYDLNVHQNGCKGCHKKMKTDQPLNTKSQYTDNYFLKTSTDLCIIMYCWLPVVAFWSILSLTGGVALLSVWPSVSLVISSNLNSGQILYSIKSVYVSLTILHVVQKSLHVLKSVHSSIILADFKR